jgi:hypothetical protein
MKPHPHNTYGFEIKEEYDVDAHMWSPGYDGPALLCEDCARHGQRCGNPDVCDAWGTPDGPDPVIHEGTLVWHEGARLWICPECDEDCDTCSDCDTWHEKEFMTEVIWHPKAWPKGMNDSKWICKPCTAERVSQEE